ncbi:hypothetical protein [Mesorhizobium sp. A556]
MSAAYSLAPPAEDADPPPQNRAKGRTPAGTFPGTGGQKIENKQEKIIHPVLANRFL